MPSEWPPRQIGARASRHGGCVICTHGHVCAHRLRARGPARMPMSQRRSSPGGGPYGFSFASSLMMSLGARPSRSESTSNGSMGVYGAIVFRCGRMKSEPRTAADGDADAGAACADMSPRFAEARVGGQLLRGLLAHSCCNDGASILSDNLEEVVD